MNKRKKEQKSKKKRFLFILEIACRKKKTRFSAD